MVLLPGQRRRHALGGRGRGPGGPHTGRPAQSLVYGEGDRYAAQYAVHPGEMVGEMPVGMQSFGDTDEPYWPQAANATYKEVWTSTVGRYLLLLSALEVDL